MLESLRGALATVQNELSNRYSSEAIASLLKTQAGSNLLLKYQLSIEMIEQMNDENIRLANLCSTRMGRAQQMCNERAETILACYSHLRSLKQTVKELNDLNRKIDKLNRFCLQTEQAITHLEAIRIVADADADIASMKNDLKKEKAKINNYLKYENDYANTVHSSLSLKKDDLRLQDEFDAEKQRLEEVALEEFLSNHENEG